MVKVSIQEEAITIINIYVLKIGPLRYLQQILTEIKGQQWTNPPDRKSIKQLNNTTEKLDLIDIFTSKKYQNIHSSQVHMGYSQGLTTY